MRIPETRKQMKNGAANDNRAYWTNSPGKPGGEDERCAADKDGSRAVPEEGRGGMKAARGQSRKGGTAAQLSCGRAFQLLSFYPDDIIWKSEP